MLINFNNDDSIIEVDQEFEINEENLKNTDIKKISKIKIKGNINKLDDSLFDVNINTSGVMTLLCALSLEEVEYPFDIKIRKS